MYNLTVRKLEDETVAKLKRIAKEKRMSLESLARTVLTSYSIAPELKEMEDKYKRLVQETRALYEEIIKENENVILENSYLISKAMSIIEEKEV